MSPVVRAGAVFLVLFTAAFVVSVGDLVGAFADSDRVLIERFADEGNRLRDIAGAYLLALSGLSFVWFAFTLSRDAAASRVPLLLTGSLAAVGMISAAVAFATVPMSLWFGSLVDDPGLQEGQAVLPQLGYVVLAMGAMLPAAAFMVIVARADGLVPRWLSFATYPASALVALTALLFMPLFLFAAWVVAVVATSSRS